MRIAFLSPSGGLGGAERCLVDLVASLARAESRPEMCVFVAAPGPLCARIEALGARAAVVPMPPSLLRVGETDVRLGGGLRRGGAAMALAARGLAAAVVHARALGRALDAFGPDVVHTNGMKYHLLGGLAAPRTARLVWHVRDMIGERPVMSRLLRLARPRAAGAIAISRLVADDLARELPRLRSVVVHDAIDVDEFSPGAGEPERLDHLAGFPFQPALRVGLVATYARWKGHEVFLEAARRTPTAVAGLPVRYYVVGGPIYATAGSQLTEGELRASAARLGVADRVGFVGFQADPGWLFRTLDVAVHASTRPEPFGRTIAEAIACGCPVIASRTNGAAEALDDGRDAVLVPPGDPQALRDAIVRLGDRTRRGELSRHAREAAVARFGRARLAAEVTAAYEVLFRGSKGGGPR